MLAADVTFEMFVVDGLGDTGCGLCKSLGRDGEWLVRLSRSLFFDVNEVTQIMSVVQKEDEHGEQVVTFVPMIVVMRKGEAFDDPISLP